VRRLERAGEAAPVDGAAAVTRETFAHSLRARVADAAGQPTLALAELDRARWPRIASSFMDEALDRYYRADLLQRLGRLDEAKGWYRSIAQRATYELPYLAPSRLRLAQIAESQRDVNEAARMHRAFLAVWRTPDPQLARLVREARARLGERR
jgi:tetratricopeptide (TPR) repeat protein